MGTQPCIFHCGQLQRIQTQNRQSRNSGKISRQDCLALISDVTVKTRTLSDAVAAATRQKTQFIQRLKEQATRQKRFSTELLRAKAAQVVGSGAFGSADLSRVANAAARMKQATGQDINETISQFKKLKEDLVNAVVAMWVTYTTMFEQVIV